MNQHTSPDLQTTPENDPPVRMRRQVLVGGAGLVSLASAMCWPHRAWSAHRSPATPDALSFQPVSKQFTDDVTLPPGYRYQVIHATGDALNFEVPGFTGLGLETDDFSQRVGDQHDGLDIFFITEAGRYTTDNTGRALLVVNHESSAEAAFLHRNGQTSGSKTGLKFHQFGQWDGGARPVAEVLKEINLHGVSIVEVRHGPSGWRMVRGSSFNRRITPETPALVSGPRAEMPAIGRLLATRYDPTGQRCRGTINNCGMGRTPWGTYLTCEENFYPYFSMTEGGEPPDPRSQHALQRYGVVTAPLKEGARNRSQGWHTADPNDSRFSRWDTARKGATPAHDYRQEPNTFGYVMEIDPTQADKPPIKRVSLGRFVHEAALFGEPIKGEPLSVYMGCDGRNEYIYKYVSKARWNPADSAGGLESGDRYLNDGSLYAARFLPDGTGEWLALQIDNPAIQSEKTFGFQSQAEVLVYARLAADAVGATPMDRPEWAARHPTSGEIFFAMTNNNDRNRTPGKTNAANPRAYRDADGKRRAGNPNGHILRFKEEQGRSDSMRFSWDIFLFGAEEDAGPANLSGLTADNSFSSPDGIWFSQATGICWIQTDDGAMTDETNCMMVAALPGKLGDGRFLTIQNELDGQTSEQVTRIGASLNEHRLRRFLVGPKGAEITGLCETPDGKTLFVNIQHPGENTTAPDLLEERYESHWPGNHGHGKAGRPRSATIAITRDDGGVIGL